MLCPIFFANPTISTQSADIINMTGQKTYDLFIEWCRETNPTFDTNPLKLGIKTTNLKIDGITKGPQVCFGKTKEFNIPLLKKYFNIE